MNLEHGWSRIYDETTFLFVCKKTFLVCAFQIKVAIYWERGMTCHLPSIVSSTPFKHVLYLYGVTFLLVLPLLVTDCNHSIYFTMRRFIRGTAVEELDVKEKDHRRLQSVEEYFRNVNAEHLASNLKKLGGNKSMVDILITIVTTSRDSGTDQ